MEAIAHALEFLSRAFGFSIKHAFTVKLLAPGGERHHNGPRRQLEAFGCGLSAAGRAFIESRERKSLAIRKLASNGPFDWQSIGRQYDQGCYGIAVSIRSELDALKPGNDLGSFRKIFGELDGNNHFACVDTFDFQLAFDSCA